MKHRLLFLFFVITFSTYAQKPAIRIFYGFSDAKLLEKEALDGVVSDDVESLFELGAEYQINLKNKFSVVTGLTYTKPKIKNNFLGSYGGIGDESNQYHFIFQDLEVLSISALLEFKFWNYFFLNAGPVLSFELNDPNIEYSQNGIGYHLGFGGQYHFGNFFVFANPYFKQFGTIDFKDETRDHNLNQFGAHIGIGYQF
ncbi:hypothetical protein [Zunongwangia pacifica]|uniref:Outer membrane protein beta-barrel domain-containing protein n=1 Tax=Zunongwangia pacifica TaxID=2911062 RepID=A0A9X2CKV3_9FLAO|nr:hypothetical protein [Zunongwangia pacifica]MCL6219346.1 hypothetical protein [Zunongwangia pacifica]